jgi:hypothetical protein
MRSRNGPKSIDLVEVGQMKTDRSRPRVTSRIGELPVCVFPSQDIQVSRLQADEIQEPLEKGLSK